MKLNLKVPAAVTNKFGRQILLVQKNSPTLMFATGIVGVVASTVLACRSTLKLEEVLEKTQKDMATAKELVHENPEQYTAKDYSRDVAFLRVRTVVNIGKLYAPALGVGLLSVGLLTGSHVVLSKRNVALTAAYGALERGFNEYRGRVREELGEDKDREFRFGSEEVEETVEGKNGAKVQKRKRFDPRTGKSIYAQIFDETNPNWQRRADFNALFIKCQQNYANNLLHSRGHLFLNEVYDMLGFERTRAGAVVGWITGVDGGDNFVDFGVFESADPQARAFVEGRENSVLIDFNVDGTVWDKI